MAEPLREFLRPDGSGGWKPDDRSWLYDEVLSYITKLDDWERVSGQQRHPRTERSIYERFAPTSGHPFERTRPSWDRKNRKVKRDMLAAALRRLVADGKIRVAGYRYENLKSMHGMDVRQRKSDVHLFGPKHDGQIKIYAETNVLDAIVAALEADK